jgi:ligand-binding sensor domain-containing protein
MNLIRYKVMIALVAIACLMLPPDSVGQRLPGQIVTYAEFNHVNAVASSMSHVYFATTQGITRYNKINKYWERPLTGTVGLENGEILRVWVDTFDEHLFAQTHDDLYEYDLFFERWSPVTELPDIRNDSRHIPVPVGMFPPFGYNFLADGQLVDPIGRSFQISDIIDDGAGNLWLGTWGFGAATADNTAKQIELLPYGLLQNHVNDIYDDGTRLWVSGDARFSYRTGLTAFDPEENSFSYIESGINHSLPAEDIYCLAGDERAVYIGSSYGLMVYDRQLEDVTDRISSRNGLIGNEVYSIAVVGDSIFVGTSEGLTLLDMASDSIGYINPGEFLNQAVYDFALADSTLWIAAGSGAYRLMLNSGKLQQYQDPEGIIFREAFAVETFDNEVWFASQYGVVRLDTETGKTRAFSDRTYVSRTRALAVNEGVIAISSDNGLTLFFRAKNKPLSREFTVDDGLPSDEVNCLLLDGDYLWVGTDLGLVRFYWNNPDRID